MLAVDYYDSLLASERDSRRIGIAYLLASGT